VLRNPEYTHLLPGLAKVLDIPAKVAIARLEEEIASKQVLTEMKRLIKLGVRPLAIAEDQGVSLESIEAMQRLRHFADSLQVLKSQKEGEAKQRALERVRQFMDSLQAREPTLEAEEVKKRVMEFARTLQEDEFLEPIATVAIRDLLAKSKELVKQAKAKEKQK